MKFISTLVILFVLHTNSWSQQTYIPDSNFEEALIFEGLDTVLDDSVATNLIDTLTFLDLEPFSITDLTGIADFLALEVLVCRNNNLQQLDLSNNSFLKFLNCESNFITDLNVSNNPLLIQLFAGHNNLTSIDLSQNPLLEILELNQNGLNTIDLSGNTALKSIRLANISIEEIDLATNTLLESIDVSTNQLIEIDVSSAPNLNTLVTFGNFITALDLSNNPSLESLLTMGNQITSLDLQNNPLLTYIACYSNNLTSLTLPPIDSLSGFSYNLGAGDNADLYCIECENPSFVYANWNYVIDSFTVISNDCILGIDEIEMEVSVFPNPSLDGMISIKTDANGTYRLLELNGLCIMKSSFNAGTTIADFKELKAGFYILQLELNDQLITRKIELL